MKRISKMRYGMMWSGISSYYFDIFSF